METIYFSEFSVDFHRTTQCGVPEDTTFHRLGVLDERVLGPYVTLRESERERKREEVAG
jgi:hypothetical protein